MFIDPSRRLTQGAGIVCMLALCACSDPALRTDLRPDGAPEVLAVLVMNDSADNLMETATFCKPNDDKRPGLVGAPPGTSGPTAVQICDDDLAMPAPEVTDAVPTAWYARFMFDELLDGDKVEELLPNMDGTFSGSLLNTQPATLKCNGIDVPYDGYYSPSGNSVTWPLGPSLVIAPIDPNSVPTGTECEVAIKPDQVVDKQGSAVPAAQLDNDKQGYKFQIAALELTDTNPKTPKDPTKPTSIDPKAPLVVSFNAQVDAASLLDTEVTIFDVAACDAAPVNPAHTARISADPKDQQVINISDAGAAATEAWLHATTYLVTLPAGTDIKDVAGGGLTLSNATTICFKTNA